MIGHSDGATAVVTGGTGNIGTDCAARLRKVGVKVVSADLATDTDERADVTDLVSAEHLQPRVEPTGILVNSAGTVGPSEPPVDVSLDGWRRTFGVNTDGRFLMRRAFVPGIAVGGWTELSTWRGSRERTAARARARISASKSAVIALSKPLGREVATTDVPVNSASPAVVTTGISPAINPSVLAHAQSLTPMGRFGRPEEIAELVAWFRLTGFRFSTAVNDASGCYVSY